MPLYEFETEDGEIVEEICSYEDRGEIGSEFILSDGRKAKSILSAPARMARQWATFPNGVSGQFNRSLNTMVYDNAHHDRLCKQKGLEPITKDNFGIAEAYATKKELKNNSIKENRMKLKEVEKSNCPDKAVDKLFASDIDKAKKRAPLMRKKYPKIFDGSIKPKEK